MGDYKTSVDLSKIIMHHVPCCHKIDADSIDIKATFLTMPMLYHLACKVFANPKYTTKLTCQKQIDTNREVEHPHLIPVIDTLHCVPKQRYFHLTPPGEREGV